MSEGVDEKLARWAQRDAAIGLDAELNAARGALTARDDEIVDLRARNERLAQNVSQLMTERDALARQIDALKAQPRWQQISRRVVSAGVRISRKGS